MNKMVDGFKELMNGMTIRQVHIIECMLVLQNHLKKMSFQPTLLGEITGQKS
jgi:hypothetical protein